MKFGEQPGSAEYESIFRMTEKLTWLPSPVFAGMALLTLHYDNAAAMQCGATGGASWNGMATMYALMSAAHLTPWLRLLLHRSGGVRKRPCAVGPELQMAVGSTAIDNH
jgi:hypothetical protein